MNRIFVINTGSTSTKVAFFEDDRLLLKDNLILPEEELAKHTRAVTQLAFRVDMVRRFLDENHLKVSELDIIVARGGPLPSIRGGAYRVNQLMLDILRYAPSSEHESSLSCMIGAQLAEGTGVPVMIYDGMSTDEMEDIAKITGFPQSVFSSRGHTLNSRIVAKLTAQKLHKPYAASRFIVIHFGGSVSVTAHRDGRIVDVINAYTGGPMSPQRCGRIPSDDLIRLCFSGEYDQKGLIRKLNGKSGFMGYFGTQNAKQVFERMEQGDQAVKRVVDAMIYQCAKGIAEMRIAIGGDVDRIIFTGGMAHSKYFTEELGKRVEFIAPIEILPGEYEMEALANGALGVITGTEEMKEYDILPANYQTIEEFYADIKR